MAPDIFQFLPPFVKSQHCIARELTHLSTVGQTKQETPWRRVPVLTPSAILLQIISFTNSSLLWSLQPVLGPPGSAFSSLPTGPETCRGSRATPWSISAHVSKSCWCKSSPTWLFLKYWPSGCPWSPTPKQGRGFLSLGQMVVPPDKVLHVKGAECPTTEVVFWKVGYGSM